MKWKLVYHYNVPNKFTFSVHLAAKLICIAHFSNKSSQGASHDGNNITLQFSK